MTVNSRNTRWRGDVSRAVTAMLALAVLLGGCGGDEYFRTKDMNAAQAGCAKKGIAADTPAYNDCVQRDFAARQKASNQADIIPAAAGPQGYNSRPGQPVQ